jgi:superfamily II DNA or RNA helicase
MSIKIQVEKIPYTEREKIAKELYVEKKVSKYQKFKPEALEPYHLDEKTDDIYLPFRWALSNITGVSRPNRKDLDSIQVEFVGKLRDAQKEVRDEAISLLNKNGSCILSLYCGFGKTFLAILLASKIGLKTIVLCHRIVLIQQWKESIETVCPQSKIQVLESSDRIDKQADFIIVNASNLEKFKLDSFKRIGTVIVDECHVIATETLSKSLFYTVPRYLIGLSATPHRSDGMDLLLDLYFGKEKIFRKLQRKHIVYKIETEFEPETKTTKDGKLDWNSVIESQSNSEERNQIILDIIQKYPERYFLILCKRISQAKYLISKLEEKKEDVTSLLGNNNQFNEKSRILVATVQKCGVGFSHSILNTLVIAADMEEYFIQYLGRVMRTEEGEPIVFDLVDKHSILKKHFSTRKKVYEESGGVIKKYKL